MSRLVGRGTRVRVRAVTCAAGVFALAGLACAGPAAPSVRVVALSGVQAPGAATGTVFAGEFDRVIVNGSGTVLFHAALSGPDVDANTASGFYKDLGGSLSKFVRAGDAAPNMPPGTFFTSNLRTLWPIMLNDGRAAIGLEVRAIGFPVRTSLWFGAPGNFRPIAVKNANAPGTTDIYDFFEEFAVNQAGVVVYSAGIVPTNRPPGVFKVGMWRDFGSTAPVVDLLSANPAPGFPGSTIGRPEEKLITDDGVSWYGGYIAGAGINGYNSNVLWRRADGAQVTPIVRDGVTRPVGLPAGVDFYGVPWGMGVNTQGQFAFKSYLRGTGVTANNDSALILGTPVETRLWFREGQQAPGAAANTWFAPANGMISPFEHVIVGNSGRMAFYATVLGPPPADTIGQRWMFAGFPDDLKVVAGGAAQPSGLPQGVTLNSVDRIAMNERGDIACQGVLKGPGVGTDTGVLVARPLNQGPYVIARQGQAFEVAPGDSRIVNTLAMEWSFSTGADGRHIVLNDRRELAFRLTFRDGTSGVFVATVGCRADSDSNGQVDFFDYLDFIASFGEGGREADFDGNGTVDFFDYLDFVGAFGAGC